MIHNTPRVVRLSLVAITVLSCLGAARADAPHSRDSGVDAMADEAFFLEPPPEIVNYSFNRVYGDQWVISGTVNSSTPGGTIIFGGLLDGQSTEYSAGGDFMYWTFINGPGDVSLYARDLDGQVSDTEYYFVGF